MERLRQTLSIRTNLTGALSVAGLKLPRRKQSSKRSFRSQSLLLCRSACPPDSLFELQSSRTARTEERSQSSILKKASSLYSQRKTQDQCKETASEQDARPWTKSWQAQLLPKAQRRQPTVRSLVIIMRKQMGHIRRQPPSHRSSRAILTSSMVLRPQNLSVRNQEVNEI